MLSVTINGGIKRFSELGKKDNSNPDKSKYKRFVAGVRIQYNATFAGSSWSCTETGCVSLRIQSLNRLMKGIDAVFLLLDEVAIGDLSFSAKLSRINIRSMDVQISVILKNQGHDSIIQ